LMTSFRVHIPLHREPGERSTSLMGSAPEVIYGFDSTE
jgi:hypothetical protein